MNAETRSNQGYEIIEGCTIGTKELYQDCYCNALASVREALIERCQSERQMPYSQSD